MLSAAGITKKGEKIIKEIMQGTEAGFAEHLNFIEDYEIYEAEDGMALSTPNAKEVTMKVNIVKNLDKNHCYKAVIYVDKCARN